ncbi:hypothetical protein BDFB_002630, partial [Asbolus verrucosus]
HLRNLSFRCLNLYSAATSSACPAACCETCSNSTATRFWEATTTCSLWGFGGCSGTSWSSLWSIVWTCLREHCDGSETPCIQIPEMSTSSVLLIYILTLSWSDRKWDSNIRRLFWNDWTCKCPNRFSQQAS